MNFNAMTIVKPEVNVFPLHVEGNIIIGIFSVISILCGAAMYCIVGAVSVTAVMGHTGSRILKFTWQHS